MATFIVIDGKVVDKEEAQVSEIVFQHYSSVSTKMWFGFGGIPLHIENLNAFIQELESLNIQVPALLKNKREFFRVSKRMLNKNKFYRSGYLFLQVFWKEKTTRTIITSTAFQGFDFPINEDGLLLTISERKKPAGTEHSHFRFTHQPFWQIVSAQIQHTLFGNSIILNQQKMLCECIESNVFLLSGKQLFTPSLKTGCYSHFLRKIGIEIAKKNGFTIIESDKLETSLLMQMDEIFLLSEEKGFEWVLGVENKRFVHEVSSKIYQELNAFLKEKVH